MNIRETERDGIITFAVAGRLDSNTSEAFERQLIGQIDAGGHQIVVDFSQLDYISSAGLRVLLMAAKRLKVERGSFALCGLQQHVREVFEISGFLSILTVVDSLQDARTAMGY